MTQPFFWIMILAAVSSCSAYYFGVGIYDITGPAADVNMVSSTALYDSL